MIKLSVVIPVYNSQGTIHEVVQRIVKAVNCMKRQLDYEIILINDNSRDNSLEVCKDLCEQSTNIKLISFSKNFGQHSALMAGFRLVTGDYIICMDDDLQTPPEEIGSLIRTLEDGSYDVVYAYYNSKKHSRFRNLGSRLNDIMAIYLIKMPKELKVSSYFISRRFVIDEIVKYNKPYPYILGMVLRVTQNIGNVSVGHNERKIGKSNYTLAKLLKLWLNGFTNFSVRPLRVSSILGLFFAIAGFIFIIGLVVKKLVVPETQIGWTSMMTCIIFFGGIQLMSIGLLGEYIGRIYLSINNTPQYVIKETYNVDEDNKEQ